MTVVEVVMFLISSLILGVIFFQLAAISPQGFLSMPCLLLATCGFYFLYIPIAVLNSDNNYFMGLSIQRPIVFLASIWLYLAGALFGIKLGQRRPDTAGTCAQIFEWQLLRLEASFWVIAVSGCVYLSAVGVLEIIQLSAQSNVEGPEFKLLFVLQSLNLLIPLTVIAAIRRDFDRWSVALILLVFSIFLIAGFRFRLLILLFSLATAFMLLKGWKPRLSLFAPLGLLFLLSMNIIGQTRSYGAGLSFENFNAADLFTISGSFGAEAGVSLATAYIAENIPADLFYFDPWIVGLARLIPSALWPGKPSPDYLYYILGGTDQIHAESAGIAFAQPGEILLQFGYFGVPVIAALYFTAASKISSTGAKWGGVYGLALFSICPAFFGYYMISRGYFFQVLADGIFIVGPALFLGRISRNIISIRTPNLAN